MIRPLAHRIGSAGVADAAEILALQKLAYQSEARLYDDWTLPPLTQTLESLQQEFDLGVVLKAVDDARIVGSVRGRMADDTCVIGRLVVHPEFQGRGIGSALLREIEATFPSAVRFELFTGSRSEGNLRLYERHGFAIRGQQAMNAAVTLVFLDKPNPRFTG